MDVLKFKETIINLDREFTEFVTNELINEPYVFFVPVNKFEEEKIFFNSLSKRKKYEPKFKYKKKPIKKILIRLYLYKKKFTKLEYPDEVSYLKNIYLKKIDELIIFTKMIGNCGEKEFHSLSIKAYGVPGKFMSNLSVFIVFLFKLTDSFYFFQRKKYLSKDQIIKKFNDFCKGHNFHGWELEFSKNILSVAFILPSQKRVILNESLKYSNSEILMLFKHELGVHGRRHIKGKQILGIFSFGLAKYDELEEGLATFEEFGFYNPLKVVLMPALKVVAVRVALKNGFHETFQKLYALTGNIELSYSLTMRVKRGVFNNDGAYTKDYLYFSGLFKVLWYYIKKGFRYSKIEELFLGKISFEELRNLRDLKRIKKFFSEE